MKHAGWLLMTVASLTALLLLANRLRPVAPPSVLTASCADLTQPCRIPYGAQVVEVRALQLPSALKPFQLEVRGLAGPITARFGMVGMDMGPIALPLKDEPGGVAAAQVVLPLCVQGRRDWLLWLDSQAGRIEVRFVAGA